MSASNTSLASPHLQHTRCTEYVRRQCTIASALNGVHCVSRAVCVRSAKKFSSVKSSHQPVSRHATDCSARSA
jgi:hypothetical protein